MPHILTRSAAPNDSEQAVEVLRESITRACVADHLNDPKTLELWLANKTTQNFGRWLENRENYVVVAELDSVISGVGAVVRRGKITLCYVHPHAQRRGIGGLLLTTLESKALEWGLAKLELSSSGDWALNQAAGVKLVRMKRETMGASCSGTSSGK